jgi:hypothetical protein
VIVWLCSLSGLATKRVILISEKAVEAIEIIRKVTVNGRNVISHKSTGGVSIHPCQTLEARMNTYSVG